MKKILVLSLLLLQISSLAWAQPLKVTGKVTDTRGEPLPGVNIVEKGTTNGTISDMEGAYSINLTSSSAVLVFSYVGFTVQEIPVGTNTVINVQLSEKTVGLDEVVITALGITQAKKSVGYSVQDFSGEQLSKANALNVANLFSGQVSGLTVNNPTGIFQSPTLVLRGKTPLIVIDDIPVSTNFFDLTGSDIENVTVLKGTTASALYGSRGRNGAILITTKKAGKEGLEIVLANNTMVTAGFTVWPKTQTQYGNGSNGQYEFWDGQDGGVNDGDMIWGPKFEKGKKIAQWNSPIKDNVTGEVIPWWGDVYGTKYDDKSRYSRVPIPWEYHNNLKDFLETGLVSTTDFSLSSKGEKVAQRFSASYTKQDGQVPNSYLHLGGLSYNSSVKLSNSLTFDGKLSYNKVYSPNYPRYGYGPKNHMYTILIWMGDDVNGKDLKRHLYVPGQEGYRQANFNYAWYNNVYFAAHELNQKYDEDKLNGQIKLKYDITKNLSLQARSSAVVTGLFEDRASPKSYLNYGDPRDGDYKTWNSHWLTTDNDILLTYRQPVSSFLNITVNAGGATMYQRYSQEYNATDGLIVPWVYSLNNSKGAVKASTYLQEKAIRSIYGTVDLDIMDAFYLTFAARNDWSSTLPKANNSYFYPSFSASVLISNLMKMPEAIDMLKVFVSWASVANDLSPYQISSYYANVGTYEGLTMLSYPGSLVNYDIAPEKSVSFETGLSASFFKNRFHFDLAYFNVVDLNQILDLPVSSASGFGSRKVNGNEYTTTGLEISLGAMPVRTTDFTWQSTLNWDTRVKKLTEIYGGAEKYGNYSLNERVDNYYAIGWMKSADGRVIINESTGLTIKDPYPQMLGHLDPNWRFGFINNFRYKNLSVDVNFDGAWGGVFWSRTVEKLWWGGKHPNSVKYRDQEYAAGEPVYVPDGVNIVSGELVRDTDGKVISDTRQYKENTTKVSWQSWCQIYPYQAKVTEKESGYFANVLDRSFLKLRRISLTYDLSDVLKIKGLKRTELSLYSYNVFIIKKAMLVDPDFGNDNNLQDPSARYIGLSAKLTF